jgi:hypothetical protein
MTSLFALLSLLVVVACTPSAEVTSGRSTGAINEEAPFIWIDKKFPKTIRISPSFNTTEIDIINEMGTSWKTAWDSEVPIAHTKTFFANGAVGNNSYNLNSPDKIFGIYYATTWPADVSDDALAITQLFGRRYNVGSATEYVGIVEADILVNYKPNNPPTYYAFEYDILDNGIDEGFDLRTIVLHEMGHFLGLQHVPTWSDRPDADFALDRDAYKATSVMYPSIRGGESKRIPQTKDKTALINKYYSGGAGAWAMSGAVAVYEPLNNDPGKNVKIVIELRKTGECIHKENGVENRRHHIKLK